MLFHRHAPSRLKPAALVLLGLVCGWASAAPKVDFHRDIRPVLSDTCFRCHGFDAKARKAGLRLDVRDDALKPAKSGAIPIVPGKPGESEVIRRLFATNDSELMPPPDLHKALTPAQKDLFRRWIAEGAEYRGHWAFTPPTRPDIPRIQPRNGSSAPANPIDAFIEARLEEKGLRPAPPADKVTWIRRVTLDLTGLPPVPDDVDAFLADDSPESFGRVVDRLLASPRYGERMAQDWLDAARFADSNGYQVDRDRELWAWRDWVVRAYNRNLPFDAFTIEQLAGDLLPSPTLDQRIATGFNRNHMINEEGGIIPEEFLADYCADRVETTATVWLGLTFTCARCHDHKYDPVSQRDYYGLFAFFHNVAEKGVGDYGAHIRRSTPPFLKLPAPEAEAALAALNREAADLERRWTNAMAAVVAEADAWELRARMTELNWVAAGILDATVGSNATRLAASGAGLQVPALAADSGRVTLSARINLGSASALRIDWAPLPGPENAVASRLMVGELRLLAVGAGVSDRKPLGLRPVSLPGTATEADLVRLLDRKPDTGWALSSTNGLAESGVFLLPPDDPAVRRGEVLLELELAPAEMRIPWQLRVRTTSADRNLLLPPDLTSILRVPPAARSADERKKIHEFLLARSPEASGLKERLADVRKRLDEKDLSIPVTLVMSELDQPRKTHVLIRGAYDRKGEEVGPGTPAHLGAFSPELPRNRLGLARWLVDPANPLTARVAVNRLWQSLFGTGLVRTSEDFGAQGEMPSHPELLDWLATEFMQTGWNVKSMMKLMATSAAYRRDSRFHPESRAADSDNRLLARGPRYRLSAEMIRDQALAVSGLLSDMVGGPSVRPYHPPGLYEQVVAGSSASTYVQGSGTDLYRRTLYTYWKRSVPNPAMLLFDMPFRETCVVRRARTTTPLQALNLLNDPTYVEASRFLARRMMREAAGSLESRIRLGFRIVLAREPRPAELDVLVAGWRRAEAGFRADRPGAESLLKVGESAVDPDLDVIQCAAYTTVASTLLNLDEAVTKE